jgi:hypothetical protein
VANRNLLHTVKVFVLKRMWNGYFVKRNVYLYWCGEMRVKRRWQEANMLGVYVVWLSRCKRWNGICSKLKRLKVWFHLSGRMYLRSDKVITRALTGVKKM